MYFIEGFFLNVSQNYFLSEINFVHFEKKLFLSCCIYLNHFKSSQFLNINKQLELASLRKSSYFACLSRHAGVTRLVMRTPGSRSLHFFTFLFIPFFFSLSFSHFLTFSNTLDIYLLLFDKFCFIIDSVFLIFGNY